MNPWFETIGVVLLAFAGAYLGYQCSRLRKPYWLLGYLPSLALAAIVAIARRNPILAFTVPFSWVMAGHREFVVMAVAGTVPFATLIPKLRARRLRSLVILLAVTAVLHFSILPFLMTAVVWRQHTRLKTCMTRDGVCLQGTDYTCGPAAAVTALKRLGLNGEEGDLAILMHTNEFTGTSADDVCVGLYKRYRSDGVSCHYRNFKSVPELKEAGLVIAIIKYAPTIDHYVAVLEVTEDKVIVGDPLKGRMEYSYDEFEEVWRRRGIVIRRDAGP